MAIVDVSKIPNNNKFDPVREAILELEGLLTGGFAGVTSLNGQAGNVNIVAGNNISVSAVNGVITISSTASGGGGTLDGELTLTAGDGIGLSTPSIFDGSTDINVTITNTDRPKDGQLLFVAGSGLTTLTGTNWSDEPQTWATQGRVWSVGQADVFSANTENNVSITIQHDDTSDVADSLNTGGTVIQSMSFDEFGHVQSRTPVNLDNRYLAFRTFITEDDNDSIVADVYNDTITFDGSASISVTKDASLKKINIGLSLSDIRFDNGVRIARGFIYWQEQGQPTSADTPTSSTFDFTTGRISINDSRWDQVPPLTGSAITEYYIARYESRDDGAGTSETRTVTYDDPIEATGFEGPVTFNSLAEELGGNGLTIIDGGRIKTGRVQSLGLNAVDYDAGTSFYTGEGTLFDLENGDLVSEEFSIVNGNAKFKGDVTGASGTFGTVDFNKNGYLINAAGFQLDLNGAVTIGGSKFNIPIYADDAIGTNRSFTLQAGQEYVLFYASNVPQDQLDINTVTGTWVKFIGDDGADGQDGVDGADGADGSAGVNARAVSLTMDSQSFNYSTLGTNPSPSTATVTATAINTTGTVYYEFFLNDVSQQNSTSNTFTYTPSSSYEDMPQKIEVQIRENLENWEDASQTWSSENSLWLSSTPALARDQITAFGVKAGEDAYTIILTNEAHTLPTTNEGVVTYTGSGTSIVVYKGTTELNGITSGTPTLGQFSVTATGTNVTVGEITSVGNPVVIADHSNMTADGASVSFIINIENLSTFTKIQSLSKSKQGNDGIDGADGADGSEGTNARGVNLIMDDQSFEYSVFGTNPSPSTATVTAVAVNTTGTVYYEFFLNDVSQQNSTSNTYSYTAPASYASMPQKIEVQIREGSSTGTILARDQITAFGIKAGEDAYTVILTNEAHTLPTTNTGVVTYTGSGTNIIVYKGTTELNGITSGTPAAGQFRVTATGTNVTVGSITSVGNPVVVGNHSNMTEDIASVSFSINIENQSTFTKVQSLSKSKQGQDGVDGADGADGAAGVNARAVNLIADDQSFEYSVAGTSPSPASATVTASALNTSGVVYYEFFLNDISQQNTTSNTYSYIPKASYLNMPDKIEVQIREGSSTSTVLARDQITMFGIKAGADGRDAYTIILTNEAHTLPTTNEGVVTYTGSGTRIIVYKGLTELNGITSGTPAVGQFRVTATGSNITVGSITSPANPIIVGDHSNMTSDLASVTFTVNVENQFSFTKAQSLSKSKEGADGAQGPEGPIGPQGPQGLTGDTGLKTASGIIFYQFGSSTQPAVPTASYFDFNTGQFVGLTSGWATTTPEMEAGTSTNRYWSCYYSVEESFSGSGISNTPVTFTAPERAFSFNQVVTFDSLSSSGTTIINGDNITTGVVRSIDYVSQSGSVFSASGMAIDLLNDSIETPSFAIDSDGDGFFASGNIKIGDTDVFGNYKSTITLTALANATDTGYASLGTIEFTREDIDDTVNTPRLQRLAADMEVVSFLKNELQTTVYKRQSPYSATNRLIIGEDRFFLGDPNNALIRTETISSLDYMVFNADRYQLRGLVSTTSSPANLFMDIFNNNQLSRSTSSRKYKKDIVDYDKGIDAVKSLRPVYYKGIEDGDKVFSGLIAEEVHEAGLEEFVMYDSDGQPDALAYQNMVSLLIKGMQEQQQQIDALKAEIDALKNNTAS